MNILLSGGLSGYAHDFSVNGIYYRKYSDGKTVYVTYKDTNYNSYSGSVVIPSTVTYSGTTYSVTSIGFRAFLGCSGLTSVTIPNSVTSIDSRAFSGCSGLTSVTIPNSVTSIGNNAFRDCSGLTSVTIPNSVTSIGVAAFRNCSGLTSVQFNAENCTTMGSSSYPVFDGCSNLKSLTIGANVKTIPSYAFYGRSGLISVTIPNSVTSIGSDAFSGCSGLTSVTIPNSVTSIGESAFSNCIGLSSVTIPNSVTSIGDSAFENCSGLTSVTIPNSVTLIGESAFYNSSGLTSVTIPNSVTSIGSSAFSNCIGLTSVVFNAENCTTMGSSSYPVFDGCSNLTSLTIGENVKTIPSYAFYKCSGLTSVTIGNSVTEIGDAAFSSCSGLTSVVFNAENCKTMGSSSYPVFNGCSNLTSLTIGESVKTIPSYAFLSCSGLTDLTIGSSVNSIGASAFDIHRLGRIKVLNPVPPTCFDKTVFKSVDKGNCLLTVPHGTIDLYSTTYVWWDFKRMKEDNGQGDIATIDTDSVSVTAAGGSIRVEGAEGAEAEVYSPSGELLYRGTDSTIALQRGIYIVKVAGTIRK